MFWLDFLSNRKPQQAPAVVGIGKWAHASTGAQAPATPSTPQAGQVTGTPTKCQSLSLLPLFPFFLCQNTCTNNANLHSYH